MSAVLVLYEESDVCFLSDDESSELFTNTPLRLLLLAGE